MVPSAPVPSVSVMRPSTKISLVVLSGAALAACGASARGTSASRPHGRLQATAASSATGVSAAEAPSRAKTPCGPNARETLAQAAGQVAMRIYASELSSSEVRADQRQVQQFMPLLSALASGNRAGVKEAVTSLVFSHTHVVRLRVTQGSTVLADVGGPYILAPVGGNLRLRGRSVGRYLLSVQDDSGYVKLVTRFIGVPLVIDQGSRRLPVEGALTPGPRTIPDHGPVPYRGSSYESFSFMARAFPSGALRISLLIPVPAGLGAKSCLEIRVSELERIAARVWRRFALNSAPPSSSVNAIRSLTGALSYVRAGARQLAGSSSPGPRHLPAQGTVSYRGSTYAVTSFEARSGAARVRVYLLLGTRP
jgi:hypothetical protein